MIPSYCRQKFVSVLFDRRRIQFSFNFILFNINNKGEEIVDFQFLLRNNWLRVEYVCRFVRTNRETFLAFP